AITDRVVAFDADGRTIADGTVDEVLRERADELHELGVWLPVSTLAALRLQDAGWRFELLPLTPHELHAVLESAAPPAPAPGRYAVPAGADTGSAPADPGAAQEGISNRLNTARGGAATGALITVRDLSVTRGRTEILHGIDLEVRAGEFVALVGANGA